METHALTGSGLAHVGARIACHLVAGKVAEFPSTQPDQTDALVQSRRNFPS